MPASTPATRLIFQNFNVYTGPAALSGATATGAMYFYTGPGHTGLANSGSNLIAQLANTTSASVSIDIPRQDLNILGTLKRVGTVILTPPSIQMNVSYNLTDGYNEKMLGLDIKGNSFLSGILTKVADSKNYFITYSQQGVDEIGLQGVTSRDVLALGNGFLSNYSFDASVGQVPSASISVDALNIVAYHNSSGLQTPAVNPSNSARITDWNFQIPVGQIITGGNNVFALRPGDIVAEFPSAAGFLVPLSGANGVNLQSVGLSVPISREVVNRLGSALGFSREIQFPVNCTINFRALQTELATGSFTQLYCNDAFYNGKIRIKQPTCPGQNGPDAIILTVNQFQPTNVSFGMTVGGDATVDITATAQLAGALSTDGVSFSGYY